MLILIDISIFLKMLLLKIFLLLLKIISLKKKKFLKHTYVL